MDQGDEELARLREELAALREREHDLSDFIENASLALHWVGADGSILWANQAELDLLGYTREEYIGRNITEFHVDAPVIDDILQRLTRRETLLDYESRLLCKDGSVRHVLINSNVRWDGDRFLHTRCFTRDITERKRLDESLRQSAKLESLGVLAGGIAHDFNNLLTGILGNISLALDIGGDANPARSNLQDAIEASERAANLTKQMLAYAGKGLFVIQSIDVSQLVREISPLIRISIPKHVTLRLDLQSPIPPVDADVTQIQQLLMNLIINGAEAIPLDRQGFVLVITRAQEVDSQYLAALGMEDVVPGPYVVINVHDNGAGMDEATLSKIFDPFFTTKFTGRGLGLAVVGGIVRGHKGGLKVFSAPGTGTTFRVLLPVGGAAGAQTVAQAGRAELNGCGLVLVVDDEAIVRKIAKRSLERYGYSVVMAENGREGVERFKELHPQLTAVILDMTMPVMDGEQALQNMRQISSSVPIVLSSGYNEADATRRFAGKGLAGFLQKPYTAAELANKIQTILREMEGRTKQEAQ